MGLHLGMLLFVALVAIWIVQGLVALGFRLVDKSPEDVAWLAIGLIAIGLFSLLA